VLLAAICFMLSIFAVSRVVFKQSPVIRVMYRKTTGLEMSSYKPVEKGSPFTFDYRVFIQDQNGQLVSPWHDIPMFANSEAKTFNMVVEIPRWTNAKMELATKERLNPIKQDVKNRALRFVNNIFPHHGYIWNYGAIPQTWEDPREYPHDKEIQPATKGDNDPIDVFEIGHRVHGRGSVVEVKVLGTLALIDEGETDWKVVAIDVNDPLANKLNDINDVEAVMPGLLRATHEWFRFYKVPTGKPENEFAFNGQFKNREYALKVIQETHEYWKKLVMSKQPHAELDCNNVSVDGSPHLISDHDAADILKAAKDYADPAPIESVVDQWYFLKK